MGKSKYKSAWEANRSWLKPVHESEEKAKCTLCRSKFLVRRLSDSVWRTLKFGSISVSLSFSLSVSLCFPGKPRDRIFWFFACNLVLGNVRTWRFRFFPEYSFSPLLDPPGGVVFQPKKCMHGALIRDKKMHETEYVIYCMWLELEANTFSM